MAGVCVRSRTQLGSLSSENIWFDGRARTLHERCEKLTAECLSAKKKFSRGCFKGKWKGKSQSVPSWRLVMNTQSCHVSFHSVDGFPLFSVWMKLVCFTQFLKIRWRHWPDACLFLFANLCCSCSIESHWMGRRFTCGIVSWKQYKMCLLNPANALTSFYDIVLFYWAVFQSPYFIK